MKFDCGLEGLKDVIQNYSIENDKIIINFLDGTHYEIALTEKNEQTLINKMLEQAQKRSDSGALQSLLVQSGLHLNISIFGALMLTFVLGIYYSSEKLSSLSLSLSAVLLLALEVLNVRAIGLSDKVNELKKYDIYLSIRERLEQINDPNIFNGIDNGETLLNINTLDNYSLKEIKQIRQNLALCEEYYGSFEQVDSAPSFVKKFSK